MPLRVLFCTLEYAPVPAGGAEKQARLQAEELVRRGHQVTVVCPGGSGVGSGAIAGVQVRRLPRINRRPLKTISYLISLAAYLLLRLRQYDLVHVHLANLQADVAVAAATLVGRPTYVKVAAGGTHGEVARMRRVVWLTRYFGLRRATRVQALSDEIERELASVGVPAERIRRIPNGLDTGVFRPGDEEARAAARAALELERDGLIVLFVGRLARYKGIDDLLATWRELRWQGASLVLVGPVAADAPLREPPRGRAIVHRDWSPRIVDYYRAADIFVLPSYIEGMSNSLLEAMGSGLAVIATRVGAAEAMVEDGLTGLLLDPGDRSALAGALARLLGDTGLRRRLGTSAAAAVRARFSIESVVDSVVTVYQELTSSRGEAS